MGPEDTPSLESINPQQKSITGKELPFGWPRILNREEHDAVHKRGKGLTVDQFSFEKAAGDFALSYLGVDHTQDPNNPQWKKIKETFNKFQPDVVLFEGTSDPDRIADDERGTISKFGDPGFIRYLAAEYNKNLKEGAKPIVIESGDMGFEEWKRAFLENGFSNEQIFAFMMVRDLNAKIQRAKAENRTEIDAYNSWRQEIDENLPKDPLPERVKAFERSDSARWNPEMVYSEVENLLGRKLDNQNFDFYNERESILNKMFDAESDFRDKYIVERITESFKKGKKVLVQMGSSHPVREREALEQFMS